MKLYYYLSLLVTLTLFSCKDKCADINCQNNGSCFDGHCQCLYGFEGDFCEVEIRANLLGTYTGTLTYEQGKKEEDITVRIERSSSVPYADNRDVKLIIEGDGYSRFYVCRALDQDNFEMFDQYVYYIRGYYHRDTLKFTEDNTALHNQLVRFKGVRK